MAGAINQPMITIAVITYNQAHYLDKCIESILNQNYPNLQLVIVDDNSCDWNEEKIQGYLTSAEERCFSATAYRMPEHCGPSKAYQKALNLTEGEYVLFLGGDDALTNSCVLDKICEELALDSYPDILIGFSKRTGYYNRTISSKSLQKAMNLGATAQTLRALIGELDEECFFVQSCFFNTESLQQMGGFDLSYKYAVDYPVLFKAMTNGLTARFSDTIVSVTRDDGAFHRYEVGNVYLREGKLKDWAAAIEKIVLPWFSSIGDKDGIEVSKNSIAILENRSEIECRWRYVTHNARRHWIQKNKRTINHKQKSKNGVLLATSVYFTMMICFLSFIQNDQAHNDKMIWDQQTICFLVVVLFSSSLLSLLLSSKLELRNKVPVILFPVILSLMVFLCIHYSSVIPSAIFKILFCSFLLLDVLFGILEILSRARGESVK